MILATVGTHEDPMDRLLQELDRLVEAGEIQEPVHIQSGYARYQPRRCTATPMMPFDVLQAEMAAARIIITHGGPASIMQAFAHGKVPIVVPRQSRYGEHVDDHQVRFSRKLADRVIVVLEMSELGPTLRDYAQLTTRLSVTDTGPERARAFAEKLDRLCGRLLA